MLLLAAAALAIPLRFEANRGQWNSAIRFRAVAPRYTVELSDTAITMNFRGGPLQMKFAAAKPEGLDELPGKSNYYFDADHSHWRTVSFSSVFGPTNGTVVYSTIVGPVSEMAVAGTAAAVAADAQRAPCRGLEAVANLKPSSYSWVGEGGGTGRLRRKNDASRLYQGTTSVVPTIMAGIKGFGRCRLFYPKWSRRVKIVRLVVQRGFAANGRFWWSGL